MENIYIFIEIKIYTLQFQPLYSIIQNIFIL